MQEVAKNTATWTQSYSHL